MFCGGMTFSISSLRADISCPISKPKLSALTSSGPVSWIGVSTFSVIVSSCNSFVSFESIFLSDRKNNNDAGWLTRGETWSGRLFQLPTNARAYPGISAISFESILLNDRSRLFSYFFYLIFRHYLPQVADGPVL